MCATISGCCIFKETLHNYNVFFKKKKYKSTDKKCYVRNQKPE